MNSDTVPIGDDFTTSFRRLMDHMIAEHPEADWYGDVIAIENGMTVQKCKLCGKQIWPQVSDVPPTA